MRFLNRRGAFTLVELITVISIVIILIGLLTPAINKARQQARKQEARAMIGSLEVACSMFYSDIGDYPNALSGLMEDTGDSNWHGPYMDDDNYDGANFDDPWGNDYQYATNANGYTISTTAPDGEEITS